MEVLARAAGRHVQPFVSVTLMGEPRFFFQDIRDGEEKDMEACVTEGKSGSALLRA